MVEDPRKTGDADIWFYVNASSVTSRQGEIYIRLARHDPSGEIDSLAIYMPPSTAKTLLKILEKVINDYEKELGSLPDINIISPKDAEKRKKKDYQPTIYG